MVLRKRAQEIGEITSEIKKLAEDMTETMIKEDGVGLAGPQVGVSKRIIVVQTEDGPATFINPKITKRSKKKDSMEEGCLSLPGVWVDVKRSIGIEMEALDLNGKKLNIKTEGFQARIFQHEIDHLDGELILNKAGFFKKLKLKKRIKGKEL